MASSSSKNGGSGGSKSSANRNSNSTPSQKSSKKKIADDASELPPISEAKTFDDNEEISSNRFGRYRIVEPLATGGMAQIYKAETANHRFFTLKKILRNYSNNPEFIKMFLEEAKISLSLKHPSVIRVLDFGQVDGNYYLAMEYVFGRDVGNILKTCAEKRIYIPIEVACNLIYQCCRGLDYAHNLTDSFGNKMGVIHRDISPPNILVSYNGEVKILDFGIAKAARATSRRSTRSGVLKGKFSYMSPEQAMGQPLNEQSDVFSLGIVLWELLTSRSLFFSEDEFETLERVRSADVKSPTKIRKDIPAELEAIVMKALSLKTKNRYQNAWEIAEDLKAFLKAQAPRADNRTIARFLRTCFTEDYLKRQRTAQNEGWQDVLQVGGTDEDLLLDQGQVEERTLTRSRMNDHEITWHERLLYDPKTQRRVWSNVLKVSAGFLALIVLLFVALPQGRGLLRHGLEKGRLFLLENLESPSQSASDVDESALTQEQPKGNFSNWIQKAEAAEASRDFHTALEAYSRALEINSFEPKVLARKHFMMLAEGQYAEACNWFQTQKNLEPSDRLLSEANCMEMDGQIPKAFTAYTEFLRKFPSDRRVADVKLVLELLKVRWK